MVRLDGLGFSAPLFFPGTGSLLPPAFWDQPVSLSASPRQEIFHRVEDTEKAETKNNTGRELLACPAIFQPRPLTLAGSLPSHHCNLLCPLFVNRLLSCFRMPVWQAPENRRETVRAAAHCPCKCSEKSPLDQARKRWTRNDRAFGPAAFHVSRDFRCRARSLLSGPRRLETA